MSGDPRIIRQPRRGTVMRDASGRKWVKERTLPSEQYKAALVEQCAIARIAAITGTAAAVDPTLLGYELAEKEEA